VAQVPFWAMIQLGRKEMRPEEAQAPRNLEETVLGEHVRQLETPHFQLDELEDIFSNYPFTEEYRHHMTPRSRSGCCAVCAAKPSRESKALSELALSGCQVMSENLHEGRD